MALPCVPGHLTADNSSKWRVSQSQREGAGLAAAYPGALCMYTWCLPYMERTQSRASDQSTCIGSPGGVARAHCHDPQPVLAGAQVLQQGLDHAELAGCVAGGSRVLVSMLCARRRHSTSEHACELQASKPCPCCQPSRSASVLPAAHRARTGCVCGC